MDLSKISDNRNIHFKKRKQVMRMLADICMTVLMPLLIAYSLIGEAAHEWMGIFMFLLFIFHHALNFTWHKNLFRGHYSVSRILRTISDLLLVPVMLILPLSEIMMFRYLFSGFGDDLSFARTMHLLASYWGVCLCRYI